MSALLTRLRNWVPPGFPTNGWDLRSDRRHLASLAAVAVVSLALAGCSSVDTSTAPSTIPTGTGGVGGGAATPVSTLSPTPTPTPKPTPTPTPKPTSTPTPKPTAVATQPPPPPALTVSDNIQACVPAGNYETITVHTGAGATVQIVVTYPSGSTSNGGTNNGTGTANGAGNFTDTWRVSGNATSGTANVDISASSNGQDAAASGTFKIYHPNYGETC